MTINFPSKVRAAGKNNWTYVPAIAVPSAPTIIELNAGIMTQASYDADQMRPSGSSKTEAEQRYSQEFESQGRGRKTYDFGDVDVIFDPQAPDSVDYELATAWLTEPDGFMVARLGVDHDAEFAAAQVLSVIVPVSIVDLLPVAPDPSKPNDAYLRKFQILTTGDPITDVTIAA